MSLIKKKDTLISP